MRQLSDTFLNELTNGKLAALLEYIQSDSELDLQIRDGYINIYYKGGNILKINSPRSFHIDKMYFNDFSVLNSTEAKKNPELISKYKNQRKELLSLLPILPQKYFQQAKIVMDKWDYALKDVVQHNEKKEQQMIALANRKNTEYVVLDLEYAVSRNSEFSYDGGTDKVVPRFDIIAIHNNRLVVIELKKGLGAIKGTSGIEPHIKCFNHTIGRDKNHLFIKEMCGLLEQKQKLGLLDKSLTLSDDEPIFVFAFADKEGKDEFMQFSSECYKLGYRGDLIYLNNNHRLRLSMKRDFYYGERRRQIKCIENQNNSLFENSKCIGFDRKFKTKYDYILRSQDSINNLYSGIREDSIKYFKKYNIAWWQYLNDSEVPSGHLVSSQIHCLNHLFAFRKDAKAVRLIIDKATGMQFDEVLPSLIDEDDNSFISFEFALDNDKLLSEKDDGWRRGSLCTSIDVMIVARKGKDKWLIPIEWKYTETYQGTDKTNKKRMDRYAHLIENSDRLTVPADGIAHSVYFIEPSYELMRQTLLCEQLVRKGYANDFFHINIIPSKHTELRRVVESDYVKMLKDRTKFRIIDPKDFLSPIEEQNLYPELIDYLKKRYW